MATDLQLKYSPALSSLLNTVAARNAVLVNQLQQLASGQIDIINALGTLVAIDKGALGLQNVQNWPPATKVSAIEGKEPNAVISPLRMDDYIDANIYSPLADLFNQATNNL